MRQSLRSQIMLPMAGLMLLTVFFVAGTSAVLAVRAAQQRIATQFSNVAEILESTNFPLTDAVLHQMKALTGADYVLVGADGRTLASSGGAEQLTQLAANGAATSSRGPISWGNRTWVRDDGYFHSIVPQTARGSAGESVLHVFYPEHEYRRAWQRAIYPSLAFAVLAMPVVILLAAVTARQISSRMRRLQAQVERIARGDFQQLELSERDDEIRALGESVNRMAEMLGQYEDEVRRTERMRTLALLGSGIAHQLRNLATGCNLALDIHAEECAADRNCETLDVARRQLRLMEDYLQRCLQLGKPAESLKTERVDLARLIDDLVPLFRPAAKHARIDLQWRPPMNAGAVEGNVELLRLLVMNLLGNAIEAASQETSRTRAAGKVVISLARSSDAGLSLAVSDSGAGPAEEVAGQLFEPFVTARADGVGLGLAVARDVAARHGGEIRWRRADGMTRFEVDFPAQELEARCA